MTDDAAAHPLDRSVLRPPRGKTIRPQQANALAERSPRYQARSRAAAPARSSRAFRGARRRCGSRSASAAANICMPIAAATRATGFIGVEPFVNGMAKMLRRCIASAARRISGSTTTTRRACSTGCRRPRSTGIDLLLSRPLAEEAALEAPLRQAGQPRRFARVLKPGGLFRKFLVGMTKSGSTRSRSFLLPGARMRQIR
jgi:tRNA (guanine-N7-)-methyltransferase